MSDGPLSSPAPALIADLESRQDDVLRDLDELIIRLESVLSQYNAPPAAAPLIQKAA